MKTGKTGPPGASRSRDEWICGLNPVIEAVRAGRQIRKAFIAASRREKTAEIESELRRRNIPVEKADLQFFDSRFHKGHQGIAALAAPREYADFDRLLALPDETARPALFLLLDGIEDPRNFGAILRVADAGGAHGVVIQSHRSASLTTEAIKASAGASEHVPVAMVPNIKNAMRYMKEAGVTVIGTEADTGPAPWDADLSVPVAVVVGSEGAGMRKTVREHCDLVVSLPMQGRVNSLNASVAAGVIIFEIMRQRMRKIDIL